MNKDEFIQEFSASLVLKRVPNTFLNAENEKYYQSLIEDAYRTAVYVWDKLEKVRKEENETK